MMKTSAIPLWTVASALLACAMAPSPARAGCHLPLLSTFSGESRLELLADLGALTDEPTPPPRSPCGEVRCSGDSAPAPTITIVDRAECWDRLAKAALRDLSASPHFVPPPTSLRPSHGGPLPFRPPQV